MRNYTAIVERCQDTGFYVGFIPGFRGAHTQAETLDELSKNLREVVEMLLELEFERSSSGAAPVSKDVCPAKIRANMMKKLQENR